MKKFVNYRPLLFFAFSICLGIATGYFLIFNKNFFAYAFIGILLFVVIISILIGIKKKNLKSMIVFSLVFLLLFLFVLFSFCFSVKSYNSADKKGHYYNVTARIKVIESGDSYSTALLDCVNLDGVNGGNSKYKIQAYIIGENQFDVGDEISFYASLVDRTIMYEGRFSASSVQKKIKYNVEIDASEITKISTRKTVFEVANTWIRDTLKSGLSNEEFSVAYALLTGDSTLIDETTLTNFRSAGVAHIFAVSGMHIGFLALFFSFLLKRIRIKQGIKATIISFLLIFYSGICGFSASSIRATIMCMVFLYSRALGYKYDNLSTISLAMIIILVISPVQMFCAGFVLSFGVVYGLYFLGRPLRKLFSFLPKKIANSLSSVISAQLVSIPFSLLFFKQFSLISVISNLLFLPFIGIIFIILLLSTIFAGIFNLSLILLPANYIIKGIIFLINIIDYKFFILSGISIGVLSVLYYLIIIIVSDVFNLRKITKFISCIILSCIVVVGSICMTLDDKKSLNVYISGSESASFTLLYENGKSTAIISSLDYIFSTYTFDRVKRDKSIEKLNAVVVLEGCRNKDIQVIATKLYSVFGEIDYFYYYGEYNETVYKVMNKTFPKTTVIALSLGNSYNINGNICEVMNNGYVLKVNNNDRKMLVFSRFNERVNYGGIEGEYSLVTAYDYLEQIQSKYSPKTFISYRKNLIYQNAESSGYIKIKF